MKYEDVKALVLETVRTELKSLLEKKKKQKNNKWLEGEEIDLKILEKTFKVFHISSEHLGPVFTFTPRVPMEPYMSMTDGSTTEDDFTRRVSLAPSVTKAVEAIGFPREYVYAGDIKGYSGDEVESVNLARNLPKCPKSRGNKYGPHFSLRQWVDDQYKNHLSPTVRRSLGRRIDSYGFYYSPKNLPKSLKQQFTGCVPDAKETKEIWSLEPVQLLNVAKHRDGHYYLTELGARVFNAIANKTDTIEYD